MVFWEEFVKNYKNNHYSENTIKTYRSVLKQYQDIFEDFRLIRKKLINYFKNPSTAWVHHNVLILFMKWKKDKRYLKIQKIKIPKVPKKYMDVFSKSYLKNRTQLVSSDDLLLRNKKLTIKFLFETGIRASELKKILEVKKDTLVVQGKGSKIREIFHNYKTTTLMEPFKQTTKTLRIWVKEILGKKFTPHSIRRSHATHMLMNGACPKMVMMQLGHEKIETTFKYLQLSKEANKKIYDKYF